MSTIKDTNELLAEYREHIEQQAESERELKRLNCEFIAKHKEKVMEESIEAFSAAGLDLERVRELYKRREVHAHRRIKQNESVLARRRTIISKKQAAKRGKFYGPKIPSRPSQAVDDYLILTEADDFMNPMDYISSDGFGPFCNHSLRVPEFSLSGQTKILCENWFHFLWNVNSLPTRLGVCEDTETFSLIFISPYDGENGWTKPTATVQLNGFSAIKPGVHLAPHAPTYSEIELQAYLKVGQFVDNDFLSWRSDPRLIHWHVVDSDWINVTHLNPEVAMPPAEDFWITFGTGNAAFPRLRGGIPIICEVTLEVSMFVRALAEAWIDMVVQVPTVNLDVFYS